MIGAVGAVGASTLTPRTPRTGGRPHAGAPVGRREAPTRHSGLLEGDGCRALLTLRPNVWHDGPVTLLDELYVVPGLRSQGLGTALLRAAEETTRQRGGELLEINVDGDDVDARRFYERHGYRNSEPRSDEQLLYYFRELAR